MPVGQRRSMNHASTVASSGNRRNSSTMLMPVRWDLPGALLDMPYPPERVGYYSTVPQVGKELFGTFLHNSLNLHGSGRYPSSGASDRLSSVSRYAWRWTAGMVTSAAP